MADEFDYKLDNVPATLVASEDIDKTFRSSCIGSSFSGAHILNTKLDVMRRDVIKLYVAVEGKQNVQVTDIFNDRPRLRRIGR